MNKFLAIFVITVSYFSCSEQKTGVNYNVIYQRVSSDRIQELDTDSGKIMKFIVYPGDKEHNGNRAEIAMKIKADLGATIIYSWQFRLSGKFLQHDFKNYHSVIAQWLNPPDYKKNESFAKIKGKQLSPILFRVEKRGEKNILLIYYGLTGDSREVKKEIVINTDSWYKVKAKIFWSLEDDGYAEIDINGQSFKITGKNKYNTVSNDFKMGLYRNPLNLDTTEMMVKNILIDRL